MIYQKLLPASTPYIVYISYSPGIFPIHKHHEIELIYSPYDTVIKLTCGEDEYTINGGELAIVGTLSPHGTEICGENCHVMVLELGPIFLKEHFNSISELDLSYPKIDLTHNNDITLDLKRCLDEIYAMYTHDEQKDELIIIGNIYRICSDIIKLKTPDTSYHSNAQAKKLKTALNYIHTNYSGTITLEEIAKMVGYSKGNFCKIFKPFCI